MMDLGFASSSLVRVGIAGGFAAIAFFAVLSIEPQAHIPLVSPTPTNTTAFTAHSTLIVETTYPVTHWHVRMGEENVTASKIESQRFEATINGDPAQCFIQAESADVLSTTPVALRWHYAGRSGMLWGEGAVAGTLSANPPSNSGERAP
jgi:hypothetical protein